MRKVYDDLPKLKVDFSFGKLIVSVVAVNLFLILPISIIEGTRNSLPTNIAEDGRVLGLTTEIHVKDSVEYTLFGVPFNPNSESGLLVVMGLILFGISLLILTFLIVDNQRSKRLNL